MRAPRTFAALASIVVVGSSADGQARRASAAGAAPEFRFPAVQTQTLANGMRVVTLETHSLPIVAVRLLTGADSTFDPTDKPGLAALTAAVMSDATQGKSAPQVQEIQADLGTHVSATRFTTTTANLEPALALMAELVQEPALPADAIAQQKAVMLRAAASPSPARIALRVFARLALGDDNAYVHVPTEQSIPTLTREDVVAFHQSYVNPRRATLVIVGDLTPTRAFQAADKAFGKWNAVGRATTAATEQPLPPLQPTTIYLVNVPGRTQAVAYVGQRIASVDASPGAALDVMTTIVGALGGSRIQTELRERRGYMYAGTPSFVSWNIKPGISLLWGFATLNQSAVDSALAIWIDELKRARNTVPTPEEMVFGRNSRMGQAIPKLETADSLANDVADALHRQRDLDWLDRYTRDVQATTAQDVMKAAAEYIDPDHLTIVVVGDRKQLEPMLRAANLAPVVVVDESARPISDR